MYCFLLNALSVLGLSNKHIIVLIIVLIRWGQCHSVPAAQTQIDRPLSPAQVLPQPRQK